MTRRAGGLVAALAIAGVLAGCVSIPTSGGVEGAAIDVEDTSDSLIDLPDDPQAGATIEEILEGFIRAGRGPQNSYRVAREYLSADFNREWSPTEVVRISNTGVQPTAIDDDSYSLEMTIAAEVDAGGRYTERSSQQSFVFEFVQEDGEWRISSAPQGTFLPASSFDRAFRAFPLYFFGPGFDALVPDLRWFPNTALAPPRIVRELLRGPSPWLGSGALVSAFPVGTTLEASFEPSGGQAVVPLSSEVGAEPASAQRRMLQQLEASLRPLGNVQGVVITVGGLPLAISEGGSQPDQQYLVAHELIGGLDGRFGRLDPDGLQDLEDIGARADALGPVAASLGPAGTSVAILGPAGVSLVPAEGDPVLLDPRPGLVAPSLDPYGMTWSVPAADPGGLVAIGPDGAAIAVPIPVSGRVVSLDVSRDGARLLVALATSSGPQLLLFGVIRDADFVPRLLGVPLALPAGSGQPLDAAWVDAQRVVVLSASDGTTAAVLYEIGGRSSSLGSLVDGRAIVGGNNGIDGIRVLDGTGAVLRPSGTVGWTDSGVSASFLGTQQ